MRLDDVAVRAVLETPVTDWGSDEPLTDAAVLAPIVHTDRGDHLLFTLRRADLASHAGEVSFPGGRREGDEAPLECAQRETREEIGTEPAIVLGGLPRRRSGTGYRVHAFVARLERDAELVLDEREVARVLSVPVVELLDEPRWFWRQLDRGHLRWRTPAFEFDGETIWGLTAIFARDLLARLRRAIDTQ